MSGDGPDGMPSRAQLISFINESDQPVHRREIARAFDIKGEQRRALKALLRDLEDEGAIDREANKRVKPPAALPAVAVLTVTDIDRDGTLLATPANWREDGPPPAIEILPSAPRAGSLAKGDRVLARLSRQGERTYEAAPIRKLPKPTADRIVGVFKTGGTGGGKAGGGRVMPADKKRGREIPVDRGSTGGATDGDLVVLEMGAADRLGPRRASVADVLGRADDPRSISLIAIAAAGIPTEFPEPAVRQAEAARPPKLGRRTDLRDIPLVTIDGADARDFDDAVFAERDDQGGWHLIVAIADVAAYVPPGSPLDREAFKRGNSCYFPDRVVPMLPEALSNGLCSLVANEDRACLAAHLSIDQDGTLRDWRFERGLMRSAARLTYEQVQAAKDGTPDDVTGPLLDRIIEPLYGAYQALNRNREIRGTLDFDLPEMQVDLDDAGHVRSVTPRKRLDSHRLIEEFMITANVAAARALERRAMPLLYRVHDEPDKARLIELRDFLKPLGYSLTVGQVAKPRMFHPILTRAAEQPEGATVMEMVLRSQQQALYQPENVGHFGLALAAYAHFTSPIRRYADLVVHRGLIRALKLGDDGLTDEEISRLDQVGEHISATERRAVGAERNAMDRYLAAYLAGRVGETFTGRVTSVTRFGLFVRLEETGADGLVPISSLPDDYYDVDERSQSLVGRRWGRVYQLGARVTVNLVEADPVTGSTLLAMAAGQRDEGAETAGFQSPDQRAGKPSGGDKRRSRPGGKSRGGKAKAGKRHKSSKGKH